ncbi:MAG: 2-amino-4-hydroxy-6-hydroxymethyldihydropteridine diphosphokinase [Gallionella sp.]
MANFAFIGLGSNLQNPVSQLQRATTAINELPDTRILDSSSMYRSAPLDCVEQPGLVNPDFVNAVIKIETTLSPQTLLQALLDIEHQHGRERTFRNAPRTLDLDVLLYDAMQMHEHGLTIPHPQMHMRAFVLHPLLEISPETTIPGIGRAKLALNNCTDQVLERIVDEV